MNGLNLEKLEKELEKQIYKESYYEFFKVAFCQLHPDDEYDENWHAQYLCGELQKEAERIWRKEPREKDIIINMPFRAAKSMITTVIFPVWCWAQNPRTKFICVSYSGDLALEHAQLSRNLINSVWFQRLYGNKFGWDPHDNAKGFYKNTEGGFRKSVGTGGQITGSGGDIIIVDDPQNPKKAASEVERENAKSFYDHTLYSRLNNPSVGVRIIVMQRLHEEDVSGHLVDDKTGRPEDHKHICIPAKYDEEILQPAELKEKYINDLFWPSRFSEKELKSYNRVLGELQAAGQLQQRPAPAEGNLVKRAWIEIVNPEEVVRNIQNEPIHFYMDTAYTEKQENDPSGILCCFKSQSQKCVYVLNIAEVFKIFPELVKFVRQYLRINGYTTSSMIKVEPKASGKSLVQQLKLTDGFNIVEIESEMIKDDKVTRLSAVSPLIQAGKWKLVRGAWNDYYLSQVCTFPNVKHDEFVDLTAYAIDDLLMQEELWWDFL